MKAFTIFCWIVTAAISTLYGQEIITGAEQLDLLIPKLKEKRVALLVNQTSVVGKTHLADTLSSLHVDIKKVFAPEHGFRGMADAGEDVRDGIDSKTKLPVVSVYGNNKKPTPAQLADIDVVVFDVQDVGVRFYTYISTLHYMMEACAENGKKIIVLDRPNPNGRYVDGPILEPAFKSFVGIHPIPIVYGMTIGELANMINGEGWLEGKKKCDLEVIQLKNYTHRSSCHLAIRPSPNLPNDHAIALYPSTCLFEGTVISVGRGTLNPFEVIGHPDLHDQPYEFMPVSLEGMSKDPPYKEKKCYGIDLRTEKTENRLSLQYLRDMFQAFPKKESFFTNYFEKLVGTNALRKQIIEGVPEKEIRKTWKKGLDAFRQRRGLYLYYPD
jgi:uncharacterized protein YbbC (DUF1343 family)